MTDRVHPKSAAANGGTTANAPFPATKAQLYGASRSNYRPQPENRRRRGRSPCCSVCIWLTAIVVSLLIILVIASTVIYLVYRPHRPSFSVNALKISTFKFTPSSQLNSKFNLNLSAKNPNKKVKFIYNSFAIAVLSNGVDVGDGSYPDFVHEKENTTVMKTTITSGGEELDGESVTLLKSAEKSKNGLPLEIKLETKVKVEMGWLKTPKVGFRVSCGGITAGVPTGKKPAAVAAVSSTSECKVNFRLKIWKWTL